MEFSTFYREQLESLDKATGAIAARKLEEIASHLLATFRAGGKLILIGNGGSAALCQHLAAEFVVRFRQDRQPLPALAFTTDTSLLTAGANDFGYHSVFSRQVEALSSSGDTLLACSTSGESPNILDAVAVANRLNLTTLGFCGKAGSSLASLCDESLEIDCDQNSSIQEAHLFSAHTICGFIELQLMKKSST